jgi:large subunit ribosomal protein L4
MPEALHYSSDAKKKGAYALPAEFDGTVNRAVLYQAVRAYRNNQRQGTASTLTRSEVSGGNRKPWRQKGTGRARHGSIRSPLWPGGGIVFGPKPRDYTTALPRKVKRLARQSALNQRATEGAIHVIEELAFAAPKTRQMAELLDKLSLSDKKVLVLTGEPKPAVYLSGRNLPRVQVMPYGDAAAYDILWADAVVVEETAIGGHAVRSRGKSAGAATRGKKAAEGKTKRGGRAVSKKRATAKKKTSKKSTKSTRKKKA